VANDGFKAVPAYDRDQQREVWLRRWSASSRRP